MPDSPNPPDSKSSKVSEFLESARKEWELEEARKVPANEKPLFLNPEAVATVEYDGFTGGPDEPGDFTSWDNEYEPLPGSTPGPYAQSTVLKPRHREIARLHALGKTNNQICEILGYCQSRVSILLKTPAMQAEVDRYRNKLYERDLATAMKDLGQDSLHVMERMLKGEDQKLRDRVETAKWLLEKVTGKPKQELSVESNSLNKFLEVMTQMADSGETMEIDARTVPHGTPELSDEDPGDVTSRIPAIADNLFDD